MLKIFDKIMKKIALNRYNSIVNSVLNSREDYKKISNEELKKELLSLKSDDFKDYKKSMSILSELSTRFFLLTPFESQLQGALVLNDGMIAEMKTGEGKTLVTVLSLILNYLGNKNAHIITANEYLVKRDYDFSKPLFDFLGITSSYIYDSQTIEETKVAYNSDIVYATSKGLVFNYLGNNRFKSEEMLFSEKRDFVIIDEIDFVLIDEARTPIILTGILETDKEFYLELQEMQKQFVGSYKDRDGEHDDPHFFYTNKMLELTEKGYNLLEKILIEKKIISDRKFLYDGSGFKYIKAIERALNANYIYKENVHYLVADGQVVIIDVQTGRPQQGRRFSDGIHQSLEAKEGVVINSDAQSLAQTTIQNYLKKYKKMAGTTGTALTEETEFKEFYSLKVIPIETTKPLIRNDSSDLLFLNKAAMKKSLLIDLKENIKNGRPSLIGVQSVSESEDISSFLLENNIRFEVLNAKNHSREAYIIEQAGKESAVTIATNMAGRGTDIMLGGNRDIFIKEIMEIDSTKTKEDALKSWEKAHDKVVESGGLSVMGIGRSDSRRLDNQLIGRAGRQGDPGMSKYYITLEDSTFANMSISFLKNQWTKEFEDKPMSASIISRMVRESQKTTESNGFNMRKNLLKFDNINTEQREIFYSWRRQVVLSKDLSSVIKNYFKDVVIHIVDVNSTMEEFLSNNTDAMEKDFNKHLSLDISIRDVFEKEDLADREDFIDFIYEKVIKNYEDKVSVIGKEDMLSIEKTLLLDIMDVDWAENISGLEDMRKSTGLRAYAQKNPFDEYQKEALEMFTNLVMDVKKDYALILRKFSPFALLEQRESLKRNQEEKNEPSKVEGKPIEIDASSLPIFPKTIKGIGI